MDIGTMKAKPKDKRMMTLRELYSQGDSVTMPLDELFDVKCVKCGSVDITLGSEESSQAGGGGCSTCGYGGEGHWKFWLGLKCNCCGNAKVIYKEDSN
jgi:hypothetical protein